MMNMSRPCTFFSILSLLLAGGNCFSQESAYIPPPGADHSILLRGKVLGGFIFEDWWLLNGTIGAEIRGWKKQSLGVDYIALKQWNEKDLWDTLTNTELGYGYSQMDMRHILLADFRQYIDPGFAKKGNLSFYLSVFGRTGRSRMWSETGYIFSANEEIKNSTRFYDAGLALGIRSGREETRRFGVDFNLGVAKRFMTESAEIFIDDNTTETVLYKRTESWISLMRLNLYFYLRGSYE